MRLRLPPLSSSAQAGRVRVRQYLDEVGRAHLTEDVVLVMTELVANAVLHARTEMILALELHGGGVRISVTDGSHVLPHWSPSSPTSLSGRGLPLVARLSERWGAEALPDGGKRVWAQLDTASTVDDTDDHDDLMELWTDEPWPVEPESLAGIDGPRHRRPGDARQPRAH